MTRVVEPGSEAHDVGIWKCLEEILQNPLQGHPETPFLRAAAEARRELMGVMGFEPPSWQAMSERARLPLMEPEDAEPGTVRRRWQHETCSRAERQFREELFAQAPAQVKALVRSQGGVGAGAALSVPPTSQETTLPFRARPTLATTYFGHNLLWPRPVLAMVSPTLATISSKP